MRLFFSMLTASCLVASTAFAQSPDEGDASVFPDTESVTLPSEATEVPVEAVPAEKPAPKPKAAPAKPKPAAKPAVKPAEKPAAAVEAPSPIEKTSPDYVMLRVNSQDVPASEVKQTWDGLFPQGAAPDFEALKPDLRDRVLRGLMAERLLWQEALKQGVDKTDTVQRELEDIKRKLVVKALLDAKTADISDKDLQSEYEKLSLAAKDVKEVRARHILVNSEKEAKDAQKSLESGKSFDEVARDYSKDPGSAKQGGDLGYFTKDKMVKEFAEAAFGLKKGETSGPVKSSFGWHIIKVEDIRPVTVPTFNDATEALKAKLQEKRLADYVRTLVKQSDVKLYDAKGKELPFNKDVSSDMAEDATN